ncbi:MAG: AlpA family phage regulatory protein [Rhodocyclaceae bacterium]|nr:AlpA family phage regulatory protein [Rhodocyclaceae bacterium]
MQNLFIPDTGFVRLPAILRVFPVSRSTWWQWVKIGKAPMPVKLGPRTTAWTAESIRAFIASHGSN